jgi:hypothetical protein
VAADAPDRADCMELAIHHAREIRAYAEMFRREGVYTDDYVSVMEHIERGLDAFLWALPDEAVPGVLDQIASIIKTREEVPGQVALSA